MQQVLFNHSRVPFKNKSVCVSGSWMRPDVFSRQLCSCIIRRHFGYQSNLCPKNPNISSSPRIPWTKAKEKHNYNKTLSVLLDLWQINGVLLLKRSEGVWSQVTLHQSFQPCPANKMTVKHPTCLWRLYSWCTNLQAVIAGDVIVCYLLTPNQATYKSTRRKKIKLKVPIHSCESTLRVNVMALLTNFGFWPFCL